MKLYTAMKLFEMGKLSLGKAAVLAGYKKWDFMHMLGKYKISVFSYEQSEIEKDVKTLKKVWVGRPKNLKSLKKRREMEYLRQKYISVILKT